MAADYKLGFNSSNPPTALSAAYNTRMYLPELMGLSPCHTPGYFGGEAWADILYKPSPGVTQPTIEDIISNASVSLWRIDTNPASGSDVGGTLGSEVSPYMSNRRQGVWNGNDNENEFRTPLDASNANNYAMQIDASINLLGKSGNRMVIQPKWETPMLNFNDSTIRPLTSASQTLTIPLHGSESVPRGIWHQFGTLETDKGVYLEVGDIPDLWLKSLQYRKTGITSQYYDINDYIPPGPGKTLENAGELKSLRSILKFGTPPTDFTKREKFLQRRQPWAASERLAKMAQSKTISEAIVAVPFVETNGQRCFFSITKRIIEEALGEKGSDIVSQHAADFAQGIFDGLLPIVDELMETEEDKQIAYASIFGGITAQPEWLTQATKKYEGVNLNFSPPKTIIDMVNKMKKYVFPPQMDFVKNPSVDPFAMYIFEFEYTLSQTDLTYIWQNLPPKIGTRFETSQAAISHRLTRDNLMGPGNNEFTEMYIPEVEYDPMPEGLQFMVFKVKKRGNNNYWSKVSRQSYNRKDQLDYSYNWPYDFFSLIEFANMDIQVGFSDTPDNDISDASQAFAITGDVLEGHKGAKVIAPGSIVSTKAMPTSWDVQMDLVRPMDSVDRKKAVEKENDAKQQTRVMKGEKRGGKKKE
jgi:hypothetical protein